MQRRHRSGWGWALVALGALACRRGTTATPTADGGALLADPVPEPGFSVRTDSTDVVFFWFDQQGQSHPVTRAGEVPEASRELVRVDPSRPELRRPGWIWMTNLRAPAVNGLLPLRAVRSESLATVLLARVGHEGPLGSPAPVAVADAGAAAPGRSSQVIVYGASWCSACHQAAAYLTRRRVAFIEKDIEQDAAAAQEMREKAQRAGVATGSIPILDVRGHIMVGFSAEAIDRALAGS